MQIVYWSADDLVRIEGSVDPKTDIPWDAASSKATQ
jgi:hypothetical protein